MRCCYSWWSAENNFIVALVLCTVVQKILRRSLCLKLQKNNQKDLEIKVLFDLTEM